MREILPQVEELMLSLKQLMPSIYQQETLESIVGLFLSGKGNAVPHHCQTKSESAISRFLNYYNWSTRSVIRTVRSYILNLILSQTMKGKTIARWGKRRWQIEGFFKTVKHCFSLHRFGQKTLIGIYRWLILSFVSYLLAYWIYLHLGNYDNLDWFYSAQQALIRLLPHILLLSLVKQLETVIPWLNGLGFDFCLMRCKI
jgi:hypothetical protein